MSTIGQKSKSIGCERSATEHNLMASVRFSSIGSEIELVQSSVLYLVRLPNLIHVGTAVTPIYQKMNF